MEEINFSVLIFIDKTIKKNTRNGITTFFMHFSSVLNEDREKKNLGKKAQQCLFKGLILGTFYIS